MRIDWDAANLALLRRLWAEGMVTNSIAARIPGATKNCIVGKAARLHLAPRPNPMGMGPKPKRIKASGPTTLAPLLAAPPIPQSIVDARPVIVAPGVVAVPPPPVRVSVHQCQWLNGNTRGAYVQCEAATAGGPWCPAHQRRVFVQSRQGLLVADAG